MKNDKPNYTEIETLSAYLDHELSEADENQLRSRLAKDAGLREQLEDLRLTRYTLRHTPKVRRQRSFTLSPEMVRKQKFAWRAINVSRMVAAAASVLFAVVVGGELLFGSSAGMLASAPAEEAVMMDSAERENLEAPMAMEAVTEAAADMPMEEPAEEAMSSADDAAEELGMGGGVEPTSTPDGTPMAIAAEPQVTQEPGGGGGTPPSDLPEPTLEAGMDQRTMPSEKVEAETPAAEAALAAEAVEGEGMLAEDEFADESVLVEEAQPLPLIRWVQGGLLLLAVVSGIAAIFFRRTAR